VRVEVLVQDLRRLLTEITTLPPETTTTKESSLESYTYPPQK